tara:strand:- start:610 stop:960 length:351 start_codon:yes stop_codon:yes gene_type:complete
MKITKRQLRRIISEAVTDNISLRVVDGSGEIVNVHVPYYIVTNALEDGLTSAGLFVEIEEFIEANYHLNAWDFTEQSEKEIEKMWEEENSEPQWDEADQDNANQEYIHQHGDPWGD